jgi:hypothetical protein
MQARTEDMQARTEALLVLVGWEQIAAARNGGLSTSSNATRNAMGALLGSGPAANDGL